MALITCSDCKKQISNYAQKCPHRGAPTGDTVAGCTGCFFFIFGTPIVLIMYGSVQKILPVIYNYFASPILFAKYLFDLYSLFLSNIFNPGLTKNQFLNLCAVVLIISISLSLMFGTIFIIWNQVSKNRDRIIEFIDTYKWIILAVLFGPLVVNIIIAIIVK